MVALRGRRPRWQAGQVTGRTDWRNATSPPPGRWGIKLRWQGYDVQALLRTRGTTAQNGILRTIPRWRTRITRD